MYSIGDWLLCNKNLFFSDGSKSFSKNKLYEVKGIKEDGGLYLSNDDDEHHGVCSDDEYGAWLQYFSKVKPFERKLKFT